MLAAAGVRRFVAKSGLGYQYVCHVGDFLGENPFYNRDAFRLELELCAAWLREEVGPTVFDVGANVGFWSTHLVQMLRGQSPQVFAFEPVVDTVVKLVHSVGRLGLGEQIEVIAAAVTCESRPVRMSYTPRDSLFAQVEKSGLNRRVGDRLVYSASLTLDEFSDLIGRSPTLLKVDVEGSEIDVFSGAERVLSSPDRPALLFEYNPQTLREVGADTTQIGTLLNGYLLHYVDDFSGQLRPLGDPVASIQEIDWVCNIFAVPQEPAARDRWNAVLPAARKRLKFPDGR